MIGGEQVLLARELGLLVDLTEVVVPLSDLFLMGGEVRAHETHGRVVEGEAKEDGALVAGRTSHARLGARDVDVADSADMPLEHEHEQTDTHELQVLVDQLDVLAPLSQALGNLDTPLVRILLTGAHDVLKYEGNLSLDNRSGVAQGSSRIGRVRSNSNLKTLNNLKTLIL